MSFFDKIKLKFGAEVFAQASLSCVYRLEDSAWTETYQEAHVAVFSKSSLHQYAIRLLAEAEDVKSLVKFGVWPAFTVEPLREDFLSFEHRGQVFGLEFAASAEAKSFFEAIEAHKGESKGADESRRAVMRFNFGEGDDQEFDTPGAELARDDLEKLQKGVEEFELPSSSQALAVLKAGGVRAKHVLDDQIRPKIERVLSDASTASNGAEDNDETFEREMRRMGRSKAKNVPPTGESVDSARLAALERKLIKERRALAFERARKVQFRKLLQAHHVPIPPPEPVRIPAGRKRAEITAAALRVAIDDAHPADEDSWENE